MSFWKKDQLLGIYDLGKNVWKEYRDIEAQDWYDVQVIMPNFKEGMKWANMIRKINMRKDEIDESLKILAMKDVPSDEEDFDVDDPTSKKSLRVTCLWHQKKFAVVLENEYDD